MLVLRPAEVRAATSPVGFREGTGMRGMGMTGARSRGKMERRRSNGTRSKGGAPKNTGKYIKEEPPPRLAVCVLLQLLEVGPGQVLHRRLETNVKRLLERLARICQRWDRHL